MKKTKEQIMHRMQEHYTELESLGYEIVGLFLQGSQNYGLDYEGSDVDTKAIVLPKFENFVMSKSPVSLTHVMENDEHIDVKDIRVMFNNFKKQNINFVEILFTDYKIMNKKYESLFFPMIENNEAIGRYNMFQALNCMCGMIREKYAALTHRYPTTAWKIDKWGYDGKQLQHMFRMKDFIMDYLAGCSYKECLQAHNAEKQIRIKTNQEYSLEEAKYYANQLVKFTKHVKDAYMESHTVSINEDVDVLIKDVLTNILKFNFKEELLKGETK